LNARDRPAATDTSSQRWKASLKPNDGL
jgi:hypothetical protein